MYGRILLVDPAYLGEAGYESRLAHACQKSGHAVLALKRQKDEALFLQELKAAVKGFGPTLILAREGLIPPCHEQLPNLAHEPANAVLSPAPAYDADYARSISSDPSENRQGMACTQPHSPERELQLAQALEVTGAERLVATHPSWPRSLAKAFPYANESYHLRTAKYFIAFAGEDAPLEAELALRIAEGCLVLVERELHETLVAKSPFPSLTSALIPFDGADLARTIAHLESDEDLFAEKRAKQTAAYEALPPIEDELAKLLRALHEVAGQTVLTYGEKAVPVTLCGWFGARNFGDDLLMLNAAHRIRKRYPNAQIKVIGAHPSIIRRDYGYEAAEPYDRPGLKRMLQGSRALVFCGGLIFDDPLATTSGDLEFLNVPWIEPTGQAAMSLYAASLGVPSVGLGIGAGPVRNEATRQAVRLMGMARMRFLPRDAQTCEWFRLSGVDPALISQKADLILGARSLVESMAEQAPLPSGIEANGYFVVSLRTWHLNPPDFAGKVAQAIDQTCRATGLRAVLLPFDDDDISIHREVMNASTFPEHITHLQERPHEEEFLAIIAHSAFAFAMRLHCSILHHVLGKPAVGLDYNDKIAAHFQLAGQEELLVALDASAATMSRALLAAHESRGRIESPLSEAVAGKAALVDEAFDELFSIIDEGPGGAAGIDLHEAQTGLAAHFPRIRSKEHVKRARIEARLKELEAECKSLRKQIKKQEAQLNSRAYRTAKAASKALSPFRKLLK